MLHVTEMMAIEPGRALFAFTAAACSIAGIVGIVLLRWRRAQWPAHRAVERAVVVASDTGGGPAAVMLRDARFGLRGKPDYVLRTVERGRAQLVALELKPTRKSGRVLESDAVQVAAYTLLLKATYGEAAASFGYLRYQSRTVRVELTPELRGRLEEIVQAIRRDRHAALVHRSHRIAARCAACAMRARCTERLTP